ALAAMGLGMLFVFLEYTRPLNAFQLEAERLAKGQADQLQPSKFRGIYRTIASNLNDGIDAAAGKGGGTRRAADLSQVLGDLPAEPQMSAFSFPGDSPAAPKPKPSLPKSAPVAPLPSAPRGPLPSAPRASAPSNDDDGVVSSVGIGEPSQKRLPSAPQRAAAPVAAVSAEDGQTAEWRAVYEEFASTKQKCGESLDGFSFERFQNTLKKNRDAIVERHGVKRVKFSVYVKDGKAALKASPIKD
ncbi:MAG TPA: MXAN_5187 C-terminal domain-containing protein, partial [Polyangiaceae bacterium]